MRYLRRDEAGVSHFHGVSHFNYLRDNVLLTRMHTRLVLASLVRLPRGCLAQLEAAAAVQHLGAPRGRLAESKLWRAAGGKVRNFTSARVSPYHGPRRIAAKSQGLTPFCASKSVTFAARVQTYRKFGQHATHQANCTWDCHGAC